MSIEHVLVATLPALTERLRRDAEILHRVTVQSQDLIGVLRRHQPDPSSHRFLYERPARSEPRNPPRSERGRADFGGALNSVTMTPAIKRAIELLNMSQAELVALVREEMLEDTPRQDQAPFSPWTIDDLAPASELSWDGDARRVVEHDGFLSYLHKPALTILSLRPPEQVRRLRDQVASRSATLESTEGPGASRLLEFFEAAVSDRCAVLDCVLA